MMNVSWLTMFYMLPKELVKKRPEYLNLPRTIRDIAYNEEYMKIMVDEGKLNPEELKQCQREIAEYIRKQADFDAEKINKYRFSWSSGDA